MTIETEKQIADYSKTCSLDKAKELYKKAVEWNPINTSHYLVKEHAKECYGIRIGVAI